LKTWERSRTNRVFAGVLGGIAERLGINVTGLRLLFTILVFVTAFLPMSLLYILLMFMMPNDQGTTR
jgi:phage shock protein C